MAQGGCGPRLWKAHFLLKQVSDNLRSFRYTKVIGFDTQIVIFYITPVCFCKMFAVNRTFVVRFFTFAAAASGEMLSRAETLAVSAVASALTNTW